MRLRECDSAASKPVHVRCLCLGVPAEAINVVIEVIANDQNYVWFWVSTKRLSLRQGQAACKCRES